MSARSSLSDPILDRLRAAEPGDFVLVVMGGGWRAPGQEICPTTGERNDFKIFRKSARRGSQEGESQHIPAPP